VALVCKKMGICDVVSDDVADTRVGGSIPMTKTVALQSERMVINASSRRFGAPASAAPTAAAAPSDQATGPIRPSRRCRISANYAVA